MSLSEKAEALARGIFRNRPVLFSAMAYHHTHRGERLDFANYPYLRQMYADNSREQGCMKSTQSGISELLLCRTLALCESGRNVFYVLPTEKLIGRFVHERFNKTVSASPHYRTLMRDTDGVANVTLKQIGRGTVAFVGSNSASSFTEFPADDSIIDENDRCDQKNILMVDDRMANSKHRTKYTVGQPSIADFGIHKKFKESKRWIWHIRCPKCGKWFHPSFLDHAVEQVKEGIWVARDMEWEAGLSREPDMYHDCGRVVDRRSEGAWVAENPSAETSYYHIGKEFSTQVTMQELLRAFSDGLDDDAAMMRFYNSDLGLPYTPIGSRLSDADLDGIVEEYTMPEMCPNPCVMGVDVGTKIHVRINEILGDGSERAVFIGWVKEKEDVVALTRSYRVVSGVIDAMPETRMSRDVSLQLPQFFRCYFHSEKSVDKADPETKMVTVNRTEILDAVVSKIREKRMVYPRNARSVEDLYAHMKANTRVYNEDKLAYEWVGEAADHYMFAEAYAVLARRILGSVR